MLDRHAHGRQVRMQLDSAVAQLAQRGQARLRFDSGTKHGQHPLQLGLERLVHAIYRSRAGLHQPPQRNEGAPNQADLADGAAGVPASDVLDRDRRHRPDEDQSLLALRLPLFG